MKRYLLISILLASGTAARGDDFDHGLMMKKGGGANLGAAPLAAPPALPDNKQAFDALESVVREAVSARRVGPVKDIVEGKAAHPLLRMPFVGQRLRDLAAMMTCQRLKWVRDNGREKKNFSDVDFVNDVLADTKIDWPALSREAIKALNAGNAKELDRNHGGGLWLSAALTLTVPRGLRASLAQMAQPAIAWLVEENALGEEARQEPPPAKARLEEIEKRRDAIKKDFEIHVRSMDDLIKTLPRPGRGYRFEGVEFGRDGRFFLKYGYGPGAYLVEMDLKGNTGFARHSEFFYPDSKLDLLDLGARLQPPLSRSALACAYGMMREDDDPVAVDDWWRFPVGVKARWSREGGVGYYLYPPGRRINPLFRALDAGISNPWHPEPSLYWRLDREVTL